MGSEVCYAVARGLDGTLWAGTTAGIGRFDGKQWRFADADDAAAVPTRALVKDAAGRMWVATSKGLRLLGAGGASAQRPPPTSTPGETVVDGDMLDATLDRYGRVWVLGASALAVVDAGGAGNQ
jgi:ligand-binding sensor domain-containing protein